ncbi:luc7-like protein 3 [Papaver somniferum]|uniref:luc7-like protein 3 n=1 Tax=Papaver somniferum TaxID=3469 RepID=UPI000E6FDE86|nr:luc7-like protein 3 [Papaver somniferum]
MAGKSSQSAGFVGVPEESPLPSSAASPDSQEYIQAKALLSSVRIAVLQKIQEDVRSKIDRQLQLQVQQREEQKAAREREREERRRERKDEEWEEKQAEKQAKAPKYGSVTESDSKSIDGFEAEGEMETIDLDSDAYGGQEEDNHGRMVYDEKHLRSRFEYEIANPKILSRTMNEGESKRLKVSLNVLDSEDENEEDRNDASSSSGTCPASSDSDSEHYEEKGLDTDEDDWL